MCMHPALFFSFKLRPDPRSQQASDNIIAASFTSFNRRCLDHEMLVTRIWAYGTAAIANGQ